MLGSPEEQLHIHRPENRLPLLGTQSRGQQRDICSCGEDAYSVTMGVWGPLDGAGLQTEDFEASPLAAPPTPVTTFAVPERQVTGGDSGAMLGGRRWAWLAPLHSPRAQLRHG